MTLDAPDWLIAWREAMATVSETAPCATQGAAAVQARAQRPAAGRATGGSQQAKGKAAPARAAAVAAAAGAPPRSPYWQGFTDPRPWPCDHGERREPVIDMDELPPRVVRRVGWSPCLCCEGWFFSPDVVSVRLCQRCKGPTDKTAPKLSP